MNEQTEIFKLDKSIWTQADFEEMCWHDVKIYGLTIEKSEDNWTADFVLDIDYIFKWVKPIPPKHTYTFWVAPCTLIFKECFDLHIDIKTDGSGLDLIEIADLNLKSKIEQEKNKFVYEWTIELQAGKISLKSYGLTQIVRKQPSHVQGQVLFLDKRGGINFGRKPC
jgi:hypothetical protein